MDLFSNFCTLSVGYLVLTFTKSSLAQGAISQNDVICVGCGCSRLLDPCCGTDGRQYGNECVANCCGVQCAYWGYCRSRSTPRNIFSSYRSGLRGNIVTCSGCGCSRLFDPCCGTDGRQYPSPCDANCCGSQCAYWGECGFGLRFFQSNKQSARKIFASRSNPIIQCGCPKYLDPVCSVNEITYDNECLAECLDKGVLYPGECSGHYL